MDKPLILRGLQQLATLGSGLGNRKKLIILIYHQVMSKPDFMRPEEIDISTFTWQMKLLSTYFNIIPLHIALKQLYSDTLPPRAICITFDDGYADNYFNALPILIKYDISACFFIASGFLNGGRMWNDTIIEALRLIDSSFLDLSQFNVGRYNLSSPEKKAKASLELLGKVKRLEKKQKSDCIDYILSLVTKNDLPDDLMLTTDQVKKLHQAGMTIGGHTVTHPILASMDNTEVEKELTENKKTLEQITSCPIDFFAYPNGKIDIDYRVEQTEIVKKAGYQAACSTNWDITNKDSDIWQLPRFRPWEKTPIQFMMRLLYMYTGL